MLRSKLLPKVSMWIQPPSSSVNEYQTLFANGAQGGSSQGSSGTQSTRISVPIASVTSKVSVKGNCCDVMRVAASGKSLEGVFARRRISRHGLGASQCP